MIILTIRTDKLDAELCLFDDLTQLSVVSWPAHRKLASTIHKQIKDLLVVGQRSLSDIQGIVVYQGPGSFTGLRIGLTVANTLADALSVPIVAALGASWQQDGIKRLLNGEDDVVTMPEYGSLPKTTTPKH